MNIPNQVKYILQKLEESGYEGYLVGGCVRDYLLSNCPNDFDITTNALPEETMKVFESDRVIPTGLKHGTVTVLHCDEPFEITTYRTETTYSDGRHPDNVEFSKKLSDDLCRRDFTVNAMAMSLDGEVVDLFGGKNDLENRIIRAVGDARERFTEDALRILRAFRFASKLGFDIEEGTLSAAIELSPRLSLVSRERVFAELEKLLCGKAASKVIEIMHCGGVFEHIFESPEINLDVLPFFDALPARSDIRLAALLMKDDNAMKHVKSLKTSAAFSDSVSGIINCRLPEEHAFPSLRRAIYMFGIQALLDRCLVERKTDFFSEFQQIYTTEDCFAVSDLKITGADVMANSALRGREVGEKLTEVLFAVFDEKIPNTYDAEIALIKS